MLEKMKDFISTIRNKIFRFISVQLKRLVKIILRIIEEIFPVPFYSKYKKKILAEVNKTEKLRKSQIFTLYQGIEEKELFDRIKEEHTRANLLDEKTSKLTLSISFGLAIIGVLSSIFTSKLEGIFQLIFFLFSSFTIIYSLFCSILSISSLKTLPFYGYGSQFLIQSKKDKSNIVLALICQEKMNIIRQLRNETAYMCIRNSFVCFLIIILVRLIIILIDIFSSVATIYV